MSKSNETSNAAGASVDSIIPVKATVAIADDGASIMSAASNLSSSIIGSGVLALSYSLSLSGSLWGSFLLLLAATIVCWTFVMLIRSSRAASAYSYKGLALRIMGRAGIIPVELIVVISSIGYVAMYLVISGDLTVKFLQNVVSGELPSWLNGIFFRCVYAFIFCAPLSMMRTISGFTPYSYAALAVIAYTVCVIIYNFIATAVKGNLNGDVPLGQFNLKGWMSVPVFILAYGAAPCVPPIYSEIKGRADGSNYKNMIKACFAGLLFCTIAYMVIGNAGLYSILPTHPQFSNGNILLCLGNTVEVNIALFGFVYVVIVSYPIVFYPCRISFYNIIEYCREERQRKLARTQAATAQPIAEVVEIDATPVTAAAAGDHPEGEAEAAGSTTDSSSEIADKDEIAVSPAVANVDAAAAADATPAVISASDLLAAGAEGKENVEEGKEKNVWYGWTFHTCLCYGVAVIAVTIAILVPSLGMIASCLGATAGVVMYFVIPTYFYLNARNYPYSVFHWHRHHIFEKPDVPFPHILAVLPADTAKNDKLAPPTAKTFWRWISSWENFAPSFLLLLCPFIIVVGLMSTFM